MYRDSGKMRKALDTFQQASQMGAPAGMPQELDRSQLSFIYQRMGGINTDLTQFDEAIAAYKKSLEISPDNADARIALGDLYLRRGQHKEALDEFTRVLAAHPDKALPHYRVADANLQMGNFSDAVAEAARALRIDPKLQKARYVNGLALMRMGRTAEGQQELQEYGKQEAAAQAELDRQRGIVVSNRGAAALVIEGKVDEGIALFRTSIETNPKEPSLRLNLGLALNMSNRFAEAASTLQGLLDSGMSDDFLIYKALSRTYENLKDARNASKSKAQFVQRMDGALEEELK
jgi:tetratricopeptide (TPR) repeat protein